MMRKSLVGILRWAGLLVVTATSPLSAAELLPAIANTGAALAVECEGNLSFGALVISSGNSATSVSIAATASPSATVSGQGIAVTGGFRPALCTVTDVVAAGGASIALSGPSGNAGTFDGRTLSGVVLKNGTETLELTLNVDKSLVLPTGSTGVGTPVYVGGTLSIPANETRRGVFSETFTITVSE
jgi:hypothetical protein